MLQSDCKHILLWKHALRTCALPLLAAAALLASGCPQNHTASDPIPITGNQPGLAGEKKASDDVIPDTGDYFPLWVPASWTYAVRECYTRILKEENPIAPKAPDDVCTRYEIRTMLENKITIDGHDIYMLRQGEDNKLKEENSPEQNSPDKETPAEPQEPEQADPNAPVHGKGYMSDGDWVYMVFIEDGKIIDKSIAGKHNLKPGDSWEKRFFAEYGTTERITCGEPGFLTLPADDVAPALYKTICCTNKENEGFKPEDYYTVCYSAGIGRVAEYASNVISEVISYSIMQNRDQTQLPPAPPR
jgi:hypothetical protein